MKNRQSTGSGKRSKRESRRVALATLSGTVLEGYDFFVYGTTSALIFNSQFFPSLSPTAGTLAAFSTFAVGFAARPVGGLIFGHFGDRFGRKGTLVVSLLMMGIATTLIGLVPNFAVIGIWAPVLLVILRFVQGIALGGEMAGATLLSMEHAPDGKQNLFAGFPQMGTPAGLVLANLVILTTSTVMPDAAFTSWGWRIPFLLSGILVVVGLFVRLRVAESPSFQAAVAHDRVVANPLAESLKVGFPRLTATLFAAVASGAVGYVFMVYSLSYGTSTVGFDRQFLVLCVTAAAAVWCCLIPFWTTIADRFGRRRMFLAGSVALMVAGSAFLPLMDSGSRAVTLVAFLLMGLVMPITHSVQGAIIADTFPVHVRYSGSSLVMQTGAIIGGGLAPMIAVALQDATGSSLGVTVYAGSISLISLVAAVFMFRMPPQNHTESAPVPTREPQNESV
ncbi:MFS transporter [Streptomyces sp. Tu 6176]|uniref:MFS transporter n=1 Tax=Streptomyces sp. Tu 6176 TaxID=1470557 RepID=UPI0004456187|nr:MFS transporter [Streptomyces sp. Tu 6176]EYT82243.1 MFS transporter [Streptomyces sp. Tu 6176]